jgi:predicted dehydrogenase
VLRDVGYDLLDLFVALLGLPGDVTAHGGRFAATAPDRFDAEDGATLLLRYSHGAAATLTAVWRPRPATREALIVGSGGILRIQPGAVEFHSDDGDSVILRRPPDADLRRAVLDQFADAVRSRPAHYAGRAVDQLRTAAVFDAAHLSRSTHAAESPVRVYQLAGLPPPRTTGRERLAPV